MLNEAISNRDPNGSDRLADLIWLGLFEKKINSHLKKISRDSRKSDFPMGDWVGWGWGQPVWWGGEGVGAASSTLFEHPVCVSWDPVWVSWHDICCFEQNTQKLQRGLKNDPRVDLMTFSETMVWQGIRKNQDGRNEVPPEILDFLRPRVKVGCPPPGTPRGEYPVRVSCLRVLGSCLGVLA